MVKEVCLALELGKYSQPDKWALELTSRSQKWDRILQNLLT